MVQSSNEVETNPPVERVSAFLSNVAQQFETKPFQPHRVFRGGHTQTLAAYAWPRRHKFKAVSDQERIFQTAPDVKVLAHCRWQQYPTAHPTIVIWHGIEGSSDSTYMLSIAQKSFSIGFNVIRMNLRTCGGTEHLTPTIYHGGLTEDLRAVVSELIAKDGLSRLCLVGVSLGGNLVLKLAGEYGDKPPAEVLAVCAISPSIDLEASAERILKRSNWLYQQDFVRRLKQRLRLKHKLFPDQYDISGLSSVKTLREFDDRYTSRAHGFDGAADYYYRASAIRVIDRIRVPTLIIHAEDDPFIPFAPMLDPAVSNNPYILVAATKQGGHVAFISAKAARSKQTAKDRARSQTNDDLRFTIYDSRGEEDRFWAENRAVEFCAMAQAAL
ncbi:MAG TPA: alpha/beta fold hydrolase [Pyrinomonadaceae bacterium]|nr:alpha/beta fold hydrolase [Pyrinomonadaceae bacterium]